MYLLKRARGHFSKERKNDPLFSLRFAPDYPLTGKYERLRDLPFIFAEYIALIIKSG